MMSDKPKKWKDLDIDNKIACASFSIMTICLLLFVIAIIVLGITGAITLDEQEPQAASPQAEFCQALTKEHMSCDWSNEELPILGLYYMNTYDMNARDAMHKAIKTLNGENH